MTLSIQSKQSNQTIDLTVAFLSKISHVITLENASERFQSLSYIIASTSGRPIDQSRSAGRLYIYAATRGHAAKLGVEEVSMYLLQLGI